VYLPRNASKTRVREATNARENRREIVKALSHGQVTRRDMVKMGLMTAAGSIVLQNGLSPFANSAYGTIPTGAPLSPLFGAAAFSQPMPRFDVLERKDPNSLSPLPQKESNQTQQLLNTALEGVSPGDTGPIEGRPPGPSGRTSSSSASRRRSASKSSRPARRSSGPARTRSTIRAATRSSTAGSMPLPTCVPPSTRRCRTRAR